MRSLLPILLLLQARAGQTGEPNLAEPPGAVEFSDAEWKALRAGEVVYKYNDPGQTRIVGISAAIAAAPPRTIWKHILDFDSYVAYLPYITASQTLSRTPIEGGESVVAYLELTTLGVVTRYTMENAWYPDKGFLNWILTPKATNALQRVRGSWQLEPMVDDSTRCLMIYRADADTRWWVPEFLQARAADRGLPVLLRLIRKRAEADVG